MNYSCDIQQQYRFVRSYKVLTSRLVMVLCLVSLLAFTAWSILVVFSVMKLTPAIWGIGSILLGITSALWLLFVYGLTFFKYAHTPISPDKLQTGEDGRLDISPATTFSLVRSVGADILQGDQVVLQHSLKALLRNSRVKYLLIRLLLDEKAVRAALEETVLPQMTWELLFERAYQVACAVQAPSIDTQHVLGAWLLHPAIQAWLRNHELKEDDIQFMVWWETYRNTQHEKKRAWWTKENMLSFSGVGLSWASGFTPLVDQFSYFPVGNIWEALPVGREAQVEELITTLARTQQSNVLLVGQPGVGHMGVVREVHRRVQTSKAHPALNGQRMVYVHVGQLLALGSSSAGQLSSVSQVLREMEQAGNIIAVLDGLSSVLGGEGEQRVNMTDVLLPFFSSTTIRVIVIVSSDEYHLRLINNPELIHLFEVIQVASLSDEDTLKLLSVVGPAIENQSKVFLPYPTLRAIVRGTTSILPHIPFPERAFDFLAEALVVAQTQKKQILTEDIIHQLISRKVGVSVGALQDNEREKLLNLDEYMHKRIVNQKVAVTALSRAMMRARAGVRSLKKPVGVFLFLGPTGVGKTETAKTLAEVYFGSEQHMLRLDMSEYQNSGTIDRLIGNQQQPTGRLTAMIEDHPFAVLLLDEFEKAAREVQQLFLQVFDEGHLTDARGQIISFKHTIIIATSNAGAEFIRQEVSKGTLPSDFSKQLREHVLQTNIFRPELLNRFDSVITFTPLSPEHIREIAILMLKSLNKRLDAEHGVTVEITDELVEYLVSIGYTPEFGARPMTRAIQDSVEYAMAQKILRNETTPGQRFTLSRYELEQLTLPG